MGTTSLVIALALVIGGIGLLVEGLRWLLTIGFVLVLAGFAAGAAGRSRRTSD